MKKDYIKPTINEIKVNLEDVIASSFGENKPGDYVVPNFWG